MNTTNLGPHAKKLPFFRYLFIALFTLIIIFFGYYWVNHKRILEDFLSKELNAQVIIGDTSINYNGITMEEITIVMPIKLQNVIKITKLEAAFPIWKVFFSSLKINRLNLIGTKLYIHLNNIEGSDNNLTNFFNNLPHYKNKVFTIKNINIYSVTFESYDGMGKAFEIWPITFLNVNDMEPDQTIAGITKHLLKLVESKMISSHILPFSEPLKQQ